MLLRVTRSVYWVNNHFPRAYLRLLPLLRAVQRMVPRPSHRFYWWLRRYLRYYREVLRLAREYVPEGNAVIDVGAGDTQVLRALEQFERRVMLDIEAVQPQRGIEFVQADFVTYLPDTRFDLVLCLQVLEHLEAPEAFARKLFEIGRTVIISVPYRWPEGIWPGHVQDPVDEAKLEQWTRRTPTEIQIVADEAERLIAVYAGDGTPVEPPEVRGA